MSIIAVLLIVFVVLLVINVPVSFSIAVASAVALATASQINVLAVAQKMFSATESFSLIAVPFFILAGGFMEGGGISKRIVRFANVLIGHIRGGLAMTCVLASMFFAGISGSTAADTAAVGSILIPAMEKENYGKDVASSVVATAGAIGIIIPPSIPMVILGISAGISIGGMFLGGIIPGIVVGVSLMFVSYRFARVRNLPKHKRASLREILSATKDAFWALLTIIIIVGGTVGGIFTPTEASVVIATYTFIIGVFVYKELPIKKIPEIFWRTGITTGVVIICVAAATAFGWIMAAEQVPKQIAGAILGFSDNKLVVMLLINVVFLLLGMIMDIAPIILVVVPIMYPIAASFGITPVHFGVMTIVNMAIGQCTPPVGISLFVSLGISKAPLSSIIRTYMKFLFAMIFALILVTYIPWISTFLPQLIMGLN